MMIKNILNRIRSFNRNERGVEVIEFAFIAPILIIFILGIVEVTRYVVINQKVSKTAYSMIDIVSRLTAPTTADINGVFTLAEDTMYPYTVTGNNNVNGVTISAVNFPVGGSEEIAWQRSVGTASTALGSTGTAPNYSGVTASPFSLTEGSAAYVIEINYIYSPIFFSTFYNRAIGQNVNVGYTQIVPPRDITLIPPVN